MYTFTKEEALNYIKDAYYTALEDRCIDFVEPDGTVKPMYHNVPLPEMVEVVAEHYGINATIVQDHYRRKYGVFTLASIANGEEAL